MYTTRFWKKKLYGRFCFQLSIAFNILFYIVNYLFCDHTLWSVSTSFLIYLYFDVFYSYLYIFLFYLHVYASITLFFWVNGVHPRFLVGFVLLYISFSVWFFVDHCLSFSYDQCIVFLSSNYDFWLHCGYL